MRPLPTVYSSTLATALAAILCLSVSHPAVAAADQPVLVTTADDTGKGSLREALANAKSATSPTAVVIATKDDIRIASPLVYEGTAPLIILGGGQRVRAAGNHDLLVSSAGADLSISDLDFRGPGGFDIDNRGDTSGVGGRGIYVPIPADATNMVRVHLRSVDVSHVAYHGIHISDCDLRHECGAGSGGGGTGSSASVSVLLEDVEIKAVGQGAFDGDGMRVDERGAGDISFMAFDSEFEEVGADGLELDEGGDGSVFATVVDNEFLDNGGYCNAEALQPFLPDPMQQEFADGAFSRDDLAKLGAGAPDPRCFETNAEFYPSGSVKSYDIEIDFDDGFDIDEAGSGDMVVVLTDTVAEANLDEGIDLDEDGNGAALVTLVRVTASQNTDDGVRISEVGDGRVIGLIEASEARSNGGYGFRIDGEGDGVVSVIVDRTKTASNAGGEQSGVRVTQESTETGSLIVRRSNLSDGVMVKNVLLTQE